MQPADTTWGSVEASGLGVRGSEASRQPATHPPVRGTESPRHSSAPEAAAPA